MTTDGNYTYKKVVPITHITLTPSALLYMWMYKVIAKTYSDICQSKGRQEFKAVSQETVELSCNCGCVH